MGGGGGAQKGKKDAT